MASNNFKVEVEGIESLNKMLKKIGDEQKGLFKKKHLQEIMLDGAIIIAKEIRTRAPRGPTGNLKRSVRVKKWPITPHSQPSVFAAIDRKIAPHAHLIEFGVPKRNIEASHFFRDAVQISTVRVTQMIKRKAKQRLKFRKGATI